MIDNNEQNTNVENLLEDQTPIMENINVENSVETTENVAPIEPISAPTPNKKKGKGPVVILLILLILAIAGGAGYMYYCSLDNTNKKPDANENNNNNNNNTNNEENNDDDDTIVATYTEEEYTKAYPVNIRGKDKVSAETTEKEKELLSEINELAKTNKNIDAIFERQIIYNISGYNSAISESFDKDFSKINYQKIALRLEDGKLYLYSNETAPNLTVNQEPVKTYKSEISNITDEVIMIKEIVDGACTFDMQKIAILTKTGDLLVVTVSDNYDNLDTIIDNLSNNTPVAINYKKINDDNTKVKAFTFYSEDNRRSTCEIAPNPVLASDNTYRNYNFEIENKVIIPGDNFGNVIVIYEDYTAAVKAYDYFINKDGQELKVKSVYEYNQELTENANSVLIIDENDYVYYLEHKNNDTLKLHKDVKVKSTVIKKTKGGMHILEITFEDDSQLTIDHVGNPRLYQK